MVHDDDQNHHLIIIIFYYRRTYLYLRCSLLYLFLLKKKYGMDKRQEKTRILLLHI